MQNRNKKSIIQTNSCDYTCGDSLRVSRALTVLTALTALTALTVLTALTALTVLTALTALTALTVSRRFAKETNLATISAL